MTTQSVPNYLTQAILVTLFCCVPLGIAAIIQAAQVNAKLQAGDYKGAVDSSERAATFCWLGFFASVAVWIIYFAVSAS